ncbi:MAG TPA: hypothetical protein PKH19_02250, partial [Candidatus Syntrophosphaera sp.]|nr:hypothetical protein [Candidatus Syntrophosphaera sp.]
MLLCNAHFYLDVGFDNEVHALLVLAGKISARFHGSPPEWYDTERLDLNGAWVYPGFIDAHTHSFS